MGRVRRLGEAAGGRTPADAWPDAAQAVPRPFVGLHVCMCMHILSRLAYQTTHPLGTAPGGAAPGQ